MSEIIFIDGMSFDKPHEKAPDFVKGKISVNVARFVKFAEEHKSDKGWLNIDLKKGKSGKLYLSLNTYKKAVPNDPSMGKVPVDSPEELPEVDLETPF